jgi:hypothetical protein
LTIIPANTAVQLQAQPNPSTNGLAVTCVAEVNPVPPATSVPTGAVLFLTNGTLQSEVALSNGLAWINLIDLPLGTNLVAVEYPGDSNHYGSTNLLQQVVLADPSPTIGSNLVLAIVKNGENTFTLTLTGATNVLCYLLESTNLIIPISEWAVVPDSTNYATNGIWGHTITNVEAGFDPAHPAGKFFRAKALNSPP